jgi:hypothetical protein
MDVRAEQRVVDLDAFIDDADDDVGATARPLPGALHPEPLEGGAKAAMFGRGIRHISASATKSPAVTPGSGFLEGEIEGFFARGLLADPQGIGARAKLFAVDQHIHAHG